MRPVLIVEDNEDLLDDLLLNLNYLKIEAKGVPHAQAMDAIFDELQPEIVVLDLGLPGEDGLSIAKRLKKAFPSLGIIMLTARSALDDRILGHHLGADHYLTKPVNYQELAAVILALHRRLSLSQITLDDSDAWIIDKHKMTVQPPCLETHKAQLTWAELNLLEVFFKSPEGLATKEDLIAGLGGSPEYFDNRRLESAISRLRRKLSVLQNSESETEEVIKAVRNVGYQFTQVLIVKNDK